MCPFTFLGPTSCFSKGSSHIRGVGQARFGLETPLYLALDTCSGLQKNEKSSKQIHPSSLSPSFSLHFLIAQSSFFGAQVTRRDPGHTQVTSGIPEWVCGRSTRSTSTVTTVAGLAAPILVPSSLEFPTEISTDLHFIQNS